MIEHYTGTPEEYLKPEINATSVIPNLTLSKNSVLVIKVKDGEYDLEELNTLQKHFQKVFCNNTVIVTYDSVDFMVIDDKSYRHQRPLAEEENPYGY